jgi:electron-transferring-flavoprotein dehydrogenase
MELHGKYVFLGEGVRGSLTKEVLAKYDLEAGKDPQKFGLGMKEIWEIDPDKAPRRQGHAHDGLAAGQERRRRVVHLPPGQQPGLCRLRGAPELREPVPLPLHGVPALQASPDGGELLKGGKRVAYGARAISEGGWQSMPKAVAPGVAILGCGVGLVNVPRIKGNHNAMLSGIEAPRPREAIAAGRSATS